MVLANIRKSMLIGAVSGLGFAGVVLLLAWLNGGPDGSNILREIINFVAALPVVIFTALKIPQVVQNIPFFIYWALVGGVFGWLLGQKKAPFKIAALVFVFGLVILHYLANVKMSREIGGALRALGKWLEKGGM